MILHHTTLLVLLLALKVLGRAVLSRLRSSHMRQHGGTMHLVRLLVRARIYHTKLLLKLLTRLLLCARLKRIRWTNFVLSGVSQIVSALKQLLRLILKAQTRFNLGRLSHHSLGLDEVHLLRHDPRLWRLGCGLLLTKREVWVWFLIHILRTFYVIMNIII